MGPPPLPQQMPPEGFGDFFGQNDQEIKEAEQAKAVAKQSEQGIKQEEVAEVDLIKQERERLNLTKKDRNELRMYIKNLTVMKEALINGKADEAYKYCALALKSLRIVFNDERLKLQKTQLAELDIRKELTISQVEEAESIRLLRGASQRRKLLKSKRR
jgi:hypothetical protein